MKHGSRVNTLLIELMIVIFFFMLASTVMVQIFADARKCSMRAGARTEALLEAQNIAELIAAGESVDKIIEDYGFRTDEDGWISEKGHYWLYIESGNMMSTTGNLRCSTITAGMDDTELFSIPCDRYEAEGSGA